MRQRFVIAINLFVIYLLFTNSAYGSGYSSINIDDFPADGAVGVILNPILVYDNIYRPAATVIELIDHEGNKVPLQRPDFGLDFHDCNLRQPVDDLLPETTYTVHLIGIVDGKEWFYSFTTGTERDDESPTVSTTGEVECDDTTFTLPLESSEDIVVAIFGADDTNYCITPHNGLVFDDELGLSFFFESDIIFVDGGGNAASPVPVTIVDAEEDCYDMWEGYSDNEAKNGCSCSALGNGTTQLGFQFLLIIFIFFAIRKLYAVT